MPGAAHETLVALLQQKPALLDGLLRALGRPGLPAQVAVADSGLRIANPLEVRPDLVLVAPNEQGPWVIVEVQLGEDAAKQRRWLAAAATLFDTRGVMGDVIVVTHAASVARWATEVARVVGPSGTRLTLEPVVVQLTLAEVDRLLAADRAELALFAAWAVHDQTGREAQRVVREAVRTLEAVLDPALRETFARAMLSMLGEPLLAFVREMLMNPQLIPESPGARALRLELEALGEIRGRVEGEADALLTVLAARGLTVDEQVRDRVTRCTDVTVLRRWIARAATAADVEQVFVGEP